MKMGLRKVMSIVMTAILVAGLLAVRGVPTEAAGKKVVVVYFTGTGTTEKMAKKIKKAAKGMLIRIEAADPYTQEDLDWTKEDSRVTVEHESASSPAESTVRPEISNLKKIKKAVKAADVVYVGYPIWWGEAPHIVYNLVEQVSLEGKTVIPFCTSISSGIGDSAKNLKKNAVINDSTKWLSGRGDYEGELPSQKKVNSWVKKMKKEY